MKVYLIDRDNQEQYEDYEHGTIAAFTTFRGASQYLIERGYKPYFEEAVSYEDEYFEEVLEFYKHDRLQNEKARALIVVMDLQE
jgi:hypothetical protein